MQLSGLRPLVLRSKPGEEPTSLQWRTPVVFSDCGRTVTVPQDLKQLAEQKFEERLAEARRHARLEQMAAGLFQAEPLNGDEAAFVEVTKLRMDNLLTALHLYSLDEHLSEAVPWGSRPSKGMIVGGLPGVVYYFLMDTGDKVQEQPVFFNVYLADGHDGWILSCQCRYGKFYFKTFAKYKPIFRRIIASFRRISTPTGNDSKV